MINIFEVNETNKMIEQENLDVRTITMGISLLDCIDSDLQEVNRKAYEKITTLAKNLVQTGEDISKEYGIPIVNKRISITPMALVGGAACKTPEDFVTLAHTLDKAAKEVGVNFIGGYSALVSKGMTKADELLIRSIPQALAETERVCSSVNLGSTKTGINMDAVKLMGEMVLATAEATKENDSLGCAKLVVFCNAPDDNPFMAGAFHGVTEADAIINVGVSGPGVVKYALSKVRGQNFEVLCETIKKTAFKITRVGQLVAQEASRRLGIPFGIVDLSLAPTPAIGDSVAEILEEIGLERVGAPGTTAALAMLNDQVKKGGVMASSYVGGLSGAFIPVSEDQGMIDAVNAGALTLEKLEAMTCVCSVGLDMIAIPGDTSAATIAGIIADEMAIGMVNQKTTAVRVIPVIGKGVGETVEFGGLLGYAPVMPVNPYKCDAFVNRGGRIPAPIHSFKN
ncbi:MAG: PFL family protein [Oliverpabstia sp.]|nr:PFL family protein [Lachnospiraceae bacterium]MDY5027163.1 PFL family protein [Oliverpabstia sp.]